MTHHWTDIQPPALDISSYLHHLVLPS